MVPLSLPGQGRVVPRGAPGPVGADGSRDVRNETGKAVPRCLVKLISDLSEADRSEIQLDVLDLPFVLAGFGSSVSVQARLRIPGGKRGRPVWDRGPGTMVTGGHPATPATNDI